MWSPKTREITRDKCPSGVLLRPVRACGQSANWDEPVALRYGRVRCSRSTEPGRVSEADMPAREVRDVDGWFSAGPLPGPDARNQTFRSRPGQAETGPAAWSAHRQQTDVRSWGLPTAARRPELDIRSGLPVHAGPVDRRAAVGAGRWVGFGERSGAPPGGQTSSGVSVTMISADRR